jgi:dTMP kinase
MGNGEAVKRGLLIIFEGLDGCGKSTQLMRAAARLEARGIDHITTREPTDGPLGCRIREMARSNERVAPEQELSWFMDDRREHVRDTIEPALAKGTTVLSDRYFLSTVAYQGARGLDADAILRASEEEFPLPDLALIFDIDVEEGLSRVAARGGVAEPAFEEAGFQREVAKVFASMDRPYIVRIDGARDPECVEQDTMDHISQRLDADG